MHGFLQQHESPASQARGSRAVHALGSNHLPAACMPSSMGWGAPPPSCPRFLQLSPPLKKNHPWPAALALKVYTLFFLMVFSCDSLSVQLIPPILSVYFPIPPHSTPLLEHPLPCSEILRENKSMSIYTSMFPQRPSTGQKKWLAPTKES